MADPSAIRCNSDGSFMSPEEIVADLLNKQWPPEEVEKFNKLPHEGSILLHFGLGRYIRNVYGLWVTANPHVRGDPDGTSDEIIQQFLTKFKGLS
jgi:hypothetical protein